MEVVQEIHQLVESSPNQAAIERSLSKERIDRYSSGTSSIHDNSLFHAPDGRPSQAGSRFSMSSSPGTVSYSTRPVAFSAIARGPLHSTGLGAPQEYLNAAAPVSFSFPTSSNPHYSSSQQSKEPDPLSYAPSVTLSNGYPNHMPLTIETLLDMETRTITSLMEGITRIGNKLCDISTSFRQRQISSRERIADAIARVFNEVVADTYKKPLTDD